MKVPASQIALIFQDFTIFGHCRLFVFTSITGLKQIELIDEIRYATKGFPKEILKDNVQATPFIP
jgi:hypothetical protein